MQRLQSVHVQEQDVCFGIAKDGELRGWCVAGGGGDAVGWEKGTDRGRGEKCWCWPRRAGCGWGVGRRVGGGDGGVLGMTMMAVMGKARCW